MSDSLTSHARAQALSTRAADERWPYTPVMDWLRRPPANPSQSTSSVSTPTDAQPIRLNADQTLSRGTFLRQLQASAGQWSEVQQTLRVPGGTHAELWLVASGDGVCDDRLRVLIEEQAHLRIIRVTNHGEPATNFSELSIDVAKDSTAFVHDFNLGAGRSHLQLRGKLQEPHAAVHLHSLSLLTGSAAAVVHADITHAAPDTLSRLEFRNVLGDRARRSATGMVRVAREGQGTDSAQVCRSLLLGPRARADMRPELEIYADQVKCAHGATCGEMDTSALHYLRSRGLDLLTARRLLLQSFVMPMIEELPEQASGPLRSSVEDRLHALGQSLDTRG